MFTLDTLSLARLVTGSLLAGLALFVAFGPELVRLVGRLRAREEMRAAELDAADGISVERSA